MPIMQDDNRRCVSVFGWIAILAIACQATASRAQDAASSTTDYRQLRAAFAAPDHAALGRGAACGGGKAIA